MTESKPGPSVAETLAGAIIGVTAEKLPTAVKMMCETLVLDIVGLCLAARGTDYVKAALAGVDGEGGCTVIGHARPATAPAPR